MLKSIKNLCVIVLFLLGALSLDAQSKMEYNVFAGVSSFIFRISLESIGETSLF
jgi:hypothetical protein